MQVSNKNNIHLHQILGLGLVEWKLNRNKNRRTHFSFWGTKKLYIFRSVKCSISVCVCMCLRLPSFDGS